MTAANDVGSSTGESSAAAQLGGQEDQVDQVRLHACGSARNSPHMDGCDRRMEVRGCSYVTS